MRTLSTIQAQQNWKQVSQVASTDQPPVPVSEPLKQLVEVIKLYRKQEEAYYSKVKRQEFAKDELHFLMKTKQKLDSLLLTIKF